MSNAKKPLDVGSQQVEEDLDPMGLEIVFDPHVSAARMAVAQRIFSGELPAVPSAALYTVDAPNSVTVETQGIKFSVPVPE